MDPWPDSTTWGDVLGKTKLLISIELAGTMLMGNSLHSVVILGAMVVLDFEVGARAASSDPQGLCVGEGSGRGGDAEQKTMSKRKEHQKRSELHSRL